MTLTHEYPSFRYATQVGTSQEHQDLVTVAFVGGAMIVKAIVALLETPVAEAVTMTVYVPGAALLAAKNVTSAASSLVPHS